MIPTKAGHYKEVPAFEKCFGGAPFNFAIGVACLGGSVGAICAVGNDQFGEFLLDTLKANNVDTTHVKIKTIFMFHNYRDISERYYASKG